MQHKIDPVIEDFLDVMEGLVLEGCSDIHIKVGQPYVYRNASLLYRHDGDKLERAEVNKIVEHITPDGLLEQFRDVGSLDVAWTHPECGRFRVNMFLSSGEPTIAFRHVKGDIPVFKDLNLPDKLAELAQLRSGIIILSGATGSGKSTTLASIIEHMNTQEFLRILTIEDPIEYMFKDKLSVISQKEVGLDTKNFYDGLKFALRQDPDVVMIGEMRDSDSFGAALKAAETGHLILTTLHSDNAAQAVNRILDFYPSSEHDSLRRELANNLQAIVGQRLLPDVYDKPRPAVEIMTNPPAVKKLLLENKLDLLPSAIESGNDDGMQSFDQALYNMAQEGVITEEVALEYASVPESLRMNLKGIFLDRGRGIIGG